MALPCSSPRARGARTHRVSKIGRMLLGDSQGDIGRLCWGEGGDSHLAEARQGVSSKPPRYQVWGWPYSQACVLAAWLAGGCCPLPGHTAGPGAPIPAAPIGDGAGDGEHRRPPSPLPHEPWHGPGHVPSPPLLLPHGEWLWAQVPSRGAVRWAEPSCVAADDQARGTASPAVHRCGRKDAAQGEAAWGWRGTGTPVHSPRSGGRGDALLLRWALTGSLCLSTSLLPCSEFPGAFKEVLELPASGSHRGLLPEGVSPHLPLRVCRRHR